MPNNIAYIVLFSWPLVTIVLFRVLPRAQAIIATIIGGYLLLPQGVQIDLPILPALDKTFLPAFSAMIMCLFSGESDKRSVRQERSSKPQAMPGQRGAVRITSRGKYSTESVGYSAINNPSLQRKESRLGSGIEKAMLMLLVITPFVTAVGNAEPIIAGPRFIDGLELYDSLSMVLSALVSVLPYLIARRYLVREEQHVLLLKGLCFAGAAYSLPALFEVRMSPQLSAWIYGFFPHSFAQHIRGGGFRPVVFLEHGLLLAIFLAMTLLAAFALWRYEARRRRWFLLGIWLLGSLALCHSLGALVIAVLFVPIIFLFSVRWQMMVASAFALILLLYPVIRSTGLVPTSQIVQLAHSINPERAASLEFRIDNEDRLLAKADSKPLAGWGGWGRARIYDPTTGQDTSTTDGVWIIVLGYSGWLGYIATFGLVTMPVIMLARFRRQLSISFATSGLCLIIAANMIDMIPNASLTPITWLIAGALAGRLNNGKVMNLEELSRNTIYRQK